MKKEYLEFYDQANDVLGVDFQILMAIEEMSELTKELCKYLRCKKFNDVDGMEKVKANIIEETADVLNVTENMAYIFGEEEVNKERDFKIKRSIDRMNS